MLHRGVTIVDTFAEAFDMRAARVLITASTREWARTAAQSMTGFATSVIGCKVEAGIEAELSAGDTPDGRPGVSVLLFGFDADGLGKRLIERVGQIGAHLSDDRVFRRPPGCGRACGGRRHAAPLRRSLSIEQVPRRPPLLAHSRDGR